jgi:hypothetical protein
MSFLTPKLPPITPTPPPPNPPVLASQQVLASGQAETAAAAAAAGKGFAGTLQTGGEGASAPATAQKALLGE